MINFIRSFFNKGNCLNCLSIKSKGDIVNILSRNIFVGSDYANSIHKQEIIQNWARELLEENKLNGSLLDDHFVLLIHQGYQFYSVKFDNLNGPIYYYHESKSEYLIVSHDSFCDWLRQMAAC